MAGPPKTGNVWLEKLLSLAFDLEWIRQAPSYTIFWSRHDLSGLEAFIAEGGFRPSSICHQHFWSSRGALLDCTQPWYRARPTLRDPYNKFVSWYFYIQNFADAFIASGDPGCRAIGKAIDHDDVLELLAGEFGSLLDHGIAWLERQDLIVRYEALHGDPATVLADACAHLNMPFATTVERAIEGAQADVMRREGADLKDTSGPADRALRRRIYPRSTFSCFGIDMRRASRGSATPSDNRAPASLRLLWPPDRLAPWLHMRFRATPRVYVAGHRGLVGSAIVRR